jgi:hypothetical protein
MKLIYVYVTEGFLIVEYGGLIPLSVTQADSKSTPDPGFPSKPDIGCKKHDVEAKLQVCTHPASYPCSLLSNHMAVSNSAFNGNQVLESICNVCDITTSQIHMCWDP